MDDAMCGYPGLPKDQPSGFGCLGGLPFFIDRWPADRDPCERLAIAMMDAQFAQADEHAHSLLLESQVDALESEMLDRGIIDDDIDFAADMISIPGLNRVDFDSVEGVDDGKSNGALRWESEHT